MGISKTSRLLAPIEVFPNRLYLQSDKRIFKAAMKTYPIAALLSVVVILLPGTRSECTLQPSGTIRKICEPCEYCKEIIDDIPEKCEEGCNNCSQCDESTDKNCRYCKEGEDVATCTDRCVKGCINICKVNTGGLKTCNKYEGCF